MKFKFIFTVLLAVYSQKILAEPAISNITELHCKQEYPGDCRIESEIFKAVYHSKNKRFSGMDHRFELYVNDLYEGI